MVLLGSWDVEQVEVAEVEEFWIVAQSGLESKLCACDSMKRHGQKHGRG
jgi:hypothetical protein